MTHHSGLLGHWLSGAAILLITAVGSSVFADEGGLAPLIKKGYVRVCADKDNLPFSSEEGPTPGFEVELARLIARELGDVENRLKELHHGLEMDRTSCPRFFANQFRVLLTLAAN